jgi:hypothetical protein
MKFPIRDTRKTLTSAKGFKLKDGTILRCENKNGVHFGVLRRTNGMPIFETVALCDGQYDSWEISNWEFYTLAAEDEFVLWKLVYA